MGLESLRAEQFIDVESITPPDIEQKRFLPVNMGGINVSLEMLNVKKEGDPGPDVWIAYYNPQNELLRQAGVNVLVERLQYLKPDLIITPSSGKSTELLEETRDWMNLGRDNDHKVDLMVLKRGEPEKDDFKMDTADAIFRKRYVPITSKGEEREMVMTREQVEKIVSMFLDGKHIVIVDDVYSSGQTINAITDLLNQVRAGMGMPHPKEILYDIVTVMRECDFGTDGELEIPHVPNLHTGIITPVIIGNLPPRPAEFAAI